MKKNIILALFFIISFDVFSQESESPNIILMIGDGMGLTQITSGMYSNNNKVALEDFQYIGLSKTHSYDNLVTDSAAAGTAMSSGKKTQNYVLGLDHMGNPLKSILSICQDKGYSTALIATSNILHATPAAFFANIDYRYNYEPIADQMTKSGINYFVGGGEQYFNSRKDKRNIINEMTENGYEFVYNISDYEKNKSNYIGFFTAKDEPYYSYKGVNYSYREDEPVEDFKGRESYLARSTEATLKKLKELSKPFFIMIEGSQIDWGGHDNDQEYMVSQFLEFNETIKVVLEFAKKDKNTVVVVTADHETGGAAIVRGDLSSSTIKNRFATPNHTASMVPVFSFGPNAHLFKGIYENTEIFNKLLSIVEK
jgi:alkaline phosphatase